MENRGSFVIGYSPEDVDRINIHLKKLLKYFHPEHFAIVGGMAIRFHLLSRGIPYPQRPFNDLDIIVNDIDEVSPLIKNDFLIAEYHPPKESGYFIVKLVDPESKTKVDVFPFFPSSPKHFVKVPFFETDINLVGIEDQLIKAVWDASSASETRVIEPKQFSDFKLLLQIADLDLANTIWIDKKFPNSPAILDEAIDKTEKIQIEHPDWIKEKSLKNLKPFKCPECRSSADFPITPMEEVFKVLGLEY